MKKRALQVAGGLLFLVILAGVASALSNLGLPIRSREIDRLSNLEQARVAEATHLRRSLGNEVWPGWSDVEIPIIVYNEEYAFLLGVADPPAGWIRMPQAQARGGAWEIVPGDDFDGQPYFRQHLTEGVTPENFTVMVGTKWVATMQTKEYAEIAFYDGFREQLPPGLNRVFPYRLAWRLVMGSSDTYIGAIEHEAFHAFQGNVAPDRLASAETATRSEARYPFDDAAHGKAWAREVKLLVEAARSKPSAESIDLVREFLANRDERRAAQNLARELVTYEREREWLEGLAKYAEVTLGRVAGESAGYTPVPDVSIDPGFDRYETRERYWSGQVSEAKRTAGRKGEIRFYYTGMVQAILLDRLSDGWKGRAFEPGLALEDLLRDVTVAGPIEP